MTSNFQFFLFHHPPITLHFLQKKAPPHYFPSPPNVKPPQNPPSPPKITPPYSPISPKPSPFPAPSTSPFENPPPHHTPPPTPKPPRPSVPPPPPHHSTPPTPPKPPRPSLPPPHPFSPPPVPAPGHHSTVIIVVFVSLGGLFFLAFLSVALCCFIKKRRKIVEQRVEIVNFDEHRRVHEYVVQGPHGENMKIVTIEEDLHIDEEIKNTEKGIEGSHVRSPRDNLRAIEMAKSSGSTGHQSNRKV